MYGVRIQNICVRFCSLSNKSKASIDEIVARLSIIAYECYFLWYFLHSIAYSSFFYADARVKALDANQVDSISIVTPAHVLFSLISASLLVFYSCNDSFMNEQY